MARPTKADAYRLGRRAYLNGEGLDLGRMAAELGVNRVTLYRWVGTKEQMLVDVTWQLTELTMRQEWEAARDVAGPRVPLVLGGFLRAMFSWPEVRRFNEENNAFLMRVMTTADYGFHARFVDAVREYLEVDVAERRTTDAVPAHDLAYACVRLVESYVYLPTITGAPPAPEAAQRVLEALLRP
ncbi:MULTISPECIES: QsdR family transcriptional regulator [unclassified Aeromicrobium]|uniref:QsdR family transcriptional regulator n=1 Tax=unclassified Aeromicrobium TaxID=2633570 RepID=UPI00396B3117